MHTVPTTLFRGDEFQPVRMFGLDRLFALDKRRSIFLSFGFANMTRREIETPFGELMQPNPPIGTTRHGGPGFQIDIETSDPSVVRIDLGQFFPGLR